MLLALTELLKFELLIPLAGCILFLGCMVYLFNQKDHDDPS